MSKASRLRIEILIALVSLAAVAVVLPAAPQTAAQTVAAPAKVEKPSYFTELWQLDRATRASKPGVTYHRSNYALVFATTPFPTWSPSWRSIRTKRWSSPK